MQSISLDLKALHTALESQCVNLTPIEELPSHHRYVGESKKTNRKVTVLVYSDSEENLKKVHEAYSKVTKIKHEMIPTVEDFVFFKSESHKSHLAIITPDELGESFFDYIEGVNDSSGGTQLTNAVEFCLSLTDALIQATAELGRFDFVVSPFNMFKSGDYFKIHGWGLQFHPSHVNYLSPEKLENMVYLKNKTINEEKSLVYNVGILFLQTFGIRVSDISGLSLLGKAFREAKNAQMISLIHKIYGDPIAELIHCILQLENKRPNLLEVKEELESIMKMIKTHKLGLFYQFHLQNAILNKWDLSN